MSLPIRESKRSELHASRSVLEIVVFYTSADLARAALKKAEEMARGLAVQLRLVRPELVPYPLAVETPAISLKHLRKEMETVLGSVGLEVEGEIVLARELETAVHTVLQPGTIVVLASHRRFWPTEEERLKRLCARLGHEVLMSYVA